jgi:hypothetical protein
MSERKDAVSELLRLLARDRLDELPGVAAAAAVIREAAVRAAEAQARKGRPS